MREEGSGMRKVESNLSLSISHQQRFLYSPNHTHMQNKHKRKEEGGGHGQCAYLIPGQMAEDVVCGDADGDLVDGEEGRVAQAVQPPVGPVVFCEREGRKGGMKEE